jgi:hypothetical protein
LERKSTKLTHNTQGDNKMNLIKNSFQLGLAIALLLSSMIAQTITIQSESGLNLLIGGEVEMEFVDVEGPGGFSNQDLTYQKVKNRSPHMRIDKAILSARVDYSENLYYKFELRFGDQKANIDKHYARLMLPSLNTRIEIGKNKPMVSTKRQTEGYPLIGTAFWKGREYHVTSKTKAKLGPIGLTGNLSFAMKRPLGTDDAAEDKSFKMMTYDDYNSKDGQTFEYGGALGMKVFGLSAQGWYYTGQLIDDYDWKTSLGFLPGYDDVVDAYEGEKDDLTHWWYGGRAGFDAFNAHVRAEYITAMDGLLPRNGYYVEGSYQIKLSHDMNIEPIVRLGELSIDRHPPTLGDPETWDRKMTTLALVTRLNKFLSLKLEYYILDETTGGSKQYYEDEEHTVKTDEVSNYFVDNSFVKDNQFVLQVKYEF